jgi:diguanylate cyclase (GGDEF)-like protein
VKVTVSQAFFAMMLDPTTLLITVVLALAVAGCLLLVTWLQSPSLDALALWMISFALASIGVALIAARGTITDFWSISIGNAIIAASYGIMWTGVRSFEGRSTSVPLMFAGTLVWLVACQFEAFYFAPKARAALMSAIIVAYSVMSAAEFWRGRDERLVFRVPIIVLLLAHALIVLIRIPLADTVPSLSSSNDAQVGWFTFLIFEAIFYAFCIAYMFGGVARERVALWYKEASLTDPLTGVANRRDFLQRCTALLRRTTFEHSPSALLLFDLDEFKSINDTYGHHIGDHALMEFCRVAASVLRPNDIFGRIGGEEFGCLIPHASLNEGRDIADRIRMQFEAVQLPVPESTITATVSVGVAASVGPDRDLASLIMSADRALYRAKANGRNRVEWSTLVS